MVFIIRSDQFQHFAEIGLADFVEKAYNVVHRHWNVQVTTAGPEATRRRLFTLARAAQRYGFTADQQALRYINVAYALDDDFPARYPWAQRLLDRSDLSPDVKINLLTEKTAEWLEGIDVD